MTFGNKYEAVIRPLAISETSRTQSWLKLLALFGVAIDVMCDVHTVPCGSRGVPMWPNI